MLIKFHHSQQVYYVYFATKQCMVITKSEDVTKQGFCTILPEENSVLGRVSYYILLEFLWEGVGWGGRLFEAGRLLTFSAFRVGAYSRWALIRGWALIRINTVLINKNRPNQ